MPTENSRKVTAVVGAKKRVAIVGGGAIGAALLDALRASNSVDVTHLVVRLAQVDAAQRLCNELSLKTQIVSSLSSAAYATIDLLIECAGHTAIREHVVPALSCGVPCVIASVGALHDDTLFDALQASASLGNTRATLVPGAIAAIDALAAAHLGGLSSVVYEGRKPPMSWSGTEADAHLALQTITGERIVFEGSAREAVRRFPKNANVAATIAIAGIGFDATRVRLIADPKVTRNVHCLRAEGAFGAFEMTIENHALESNPKTSALTVLSLLRAINNATQPVVI